MTDQPPRRAWNGEQWSTWDGSKWVLDAVQGPPPATGVPWTTPAPERPDMRTGAKSRSTSGAIAAVIALIIVIFVGVAIVRNVNAHTGGTATGGASGGANGGAGALLNSAQVQQTATFNSKGVAQVTVTVTNKSSGDADFLVDLKATSADGATLYDTGQVQFHGIAAGDNDQEPCLFYKLTKEQATGAKFVATSVKQLPATAPSY